VPGKAHSLSQCLALWHLHICMMNLWHRKDGSSFACKMWIFLNHNIIFLKSLRKLRRIPNQEISRKINMILITMWKHCKAATYFLPLCKILKRLKRFWIEWISVKMRCFADLAKNYPTEQYTSFSHIMQ